MWTGTKVTIADFSIISQMRGLRGDQTKETADVGRGGFIIHDNATRLDGNATRLEGNATRLEDHALSESAIEMAVKLPNQVILC